MTSGMGSITLWGYSPTLDLCEFLPDGKANPNILVIGSSDARHILKSLSGLYKRSISGKIQFYVLESHLEIIARQMLLMCLVAESSERMGLCEKVELFLEIFGNTLVRSKTRDYISEKATELMKIVSELDVPDKLCFLRLSHLKFKERDVLEAIFKFWRKDENFSITQMWENRIRQHLGTRFDARENIYDWDYSMKLCDRKADIIHKREYRKWREMGIAFESREGDFIYPNKTLASVKSVPNSSRNTLIWGYWADIVTSPYISYGVECEDPCAMKKLNGVYTKTARDISEINVTSMLYEICHNKKYSEDESEQLVKENVGVNSNEFEVFEDKSLIHFLPINGAATLHLKDVYKNYFDVIFISGALVHNLTPELSTTFKQDAKVVIESTKFFLEVSKEQGSEYIKKVESIAKAAFCTPDSVCDPMDDSLLYFTFNGHT